MLLICLSIYSFIFVNRFILVRASVDLGPITGTLCVKKEHIVVGTPVHKSFDLLLQDILSDLCWRFSSSYLFKSY